MSRLGSIKVKDFRKFLKSEGLKYYRTEGSHEIWGRIDLLRPITFQGAKKEIPPFHIRTNLKTLDVSVTTFLKKLKKL